MQRRKIRRGVELTELGLGVAQFGNLYYEITDEQAAGVFETAWDAGIRYFDVAPHYGLGLAERRLGALLGTRPRDEFVISTKVGRLLVPDPDATGLDDQGFVVPATARRVFDYSRDGVRRSLEESLNRLGLDRVDIVYVHDPDQHYEQAVREGIPALVELRDQRVIGAIGVGMNQSALPARFVAETDLDLVMLAGRYTLLDQGALDDLFPVAEQNGVSIVIAGVYNSGVLATERPASDATFDYEPAPAVVIERATEIAAVARAHGVTLPEAAVRFPYENRLVASVVVGAHSATQIAQSVDRYSTRVAAELWADLGARGLIRADAIAPDDSRAFGTPIPSTSIPREESAQ